MAIQISGTTVIDNSRNINAGIGTLTRLDVPVVATSFNPTSGATNVPTSTTTITITFNQTIVKQTGNITLRSGSAAGTVLRTLTMDNSNTTAGSVSSSTQTLTLSLADRISPDENIFVVVDANSITGITTTSNNPLINTYNFTTGARSEGDIYEGGILICCASPLRWVVGTNSTQVTRTWYCRCDAVTRAQQVSGCGGWFFPTVAQLQNPGYVCKVHWLTGSQYWSDTEGNSNHGCYVSAGDGNQCLLGGAKTNPKHGRAFRCVTY